ncbi:MAG: FAD-dependent oxidoreductase [Vicinamibacterales bacterium]
MSRPFLMVVDDDPQVLAAVRRDLRSRYGHDYSVVGAGSGEAALESIHELKTRGEALSLVVSDQRMPGMQGTELLTKMREIYPIARRLLLTAYSDMSAAIAAINDAHIDHYLQKPWDPPEERLFPVVDAELDEWLANVPSETKGLRLIGNQWAPRSHAIKDFLSSNLIPYRWLDVDLHPDAAALLDASGVSPADLPALIFEDGAVLRDPEPRDVAERLGRSLSATASLYDLVIIGAGPAGLAAAVYGASEGLKTLLLDCHAAGGQAGSSSRIENYLGFPAGVSGSELARRALTQAERLGAEFIVPLEVTGLCVDDGYKRVLLKDGREIVMRTVLAATGMAYREHPAAGIADHTGAGVYYGAATTEAPAFAGRRVFVIGGGNSAGQGALYLARYATDVHIVVRRDSLRDTMSQYLIHQIEKTPNVHLRPHTELVGVEGQGHVERVVLSTGGGAAEAEAADAVFVFIGTRPRSEWLPASVLRDPKGFVLTGRDLVVSEAFPRTWKERRAPLLLETSTPGNLRRRRHQGRCDESCGCRGRRRVDDRYASCTNISRSPDTLVRSDGSRQCQRKAIGHPLTGDGESRAGQHRLQILDAVTLYELSVQIVSPSSMRNRRRAART